MVTTFAMDLFRDPFFIGFNREVERDSYRVSLAVAGFDKKDIEVSVDNQTLIVKGEVTTEETGEVLHKGIAARKFTRTFALGEYMEVVGAEFKNGMLHIDVDRLIPEDKKPKTIKVK